MLKWISITPTPGKPPPGSHYLQEDNAEVIGATVNEWLIDLGLGSSPVAHAANDPDLVVMEAKRLKERPNDRATGAIERKEQHDESSA